MMRIISNDFMGFSPAFHQNAMQCCEAAFAMKQNIVIPIPVERVKICIRWTLEAATWLLTLGLLAAGVVAAACAALAWLFSGSAAVLAVGIIGGVLLGLSGVWHLLRLLERTVKQIRGETPGIG
jgi:hypothetical protein